ncbi:MAG: sugar phosphate isomerase/epimerase [Verrucomicrobia bacterium]|nr:MAG: sugar phosphate isomerase/epimerase [Verrucomicrobiota bacterium]
MTATIHDLNWCFSTLGCPELDLEGALDLAARYGLRRIEIRSLENRINMPVYFAKKWGTAERIQEQLTKRDLSIASLDTSLKLIGNNEEDRDEFLSFIPWAEALGVPYLRVFDGGTAEGPLRPEERDEAVATIRWWREKRAQDGWKVDIMVETHNAITSTAACQELQDALYDPIAILWDSHHTWKLKGEDPALTFDAIGSHVPHIHVKDSVPNPEKRNGIEYVMPCEGDMPLETLLAKLAEEGFSGTVSLEWERLWHPYLNPLVDALEQMKGLDWIG